MTCDIAVLSALNQFVQLDAPFAISFLYFHASSTSRYVFTDEGVRTNTKETKETKAARVERRWRLKCLPNHFISCRLRSRLNWDRALGGPLST